MQTYQPLASLQRIISSWWFLVFSMIVGGGLGIAAHFLLPTVYEASVVISVGMDFVRIGELTDIEHDHALESVGDILFSQDVLSAVDGVTGRDVTDMVEFLETERSFSTWILRVRNEDPDVAQQLALAWAEASVFVLNDSLEHAILAALLEERADELNDCVIGVPSEPVYGLCGLDNMDDVLDEYAQIAEAVREERLQSRGILPGMSFSIVKGGEVQAKSVLFARNTLVLAGAVLGGVLAITLLNYGIVPQRNAKND